MNNMQSITQAYTQAPWRKQLQYIGLFLLILILGALVAFFYLNVSARAAEVGRTIQGNRREIDVFKREIVDLETQLAYMTSNTEMQKRARELGFYPIDQDEVLFLIVPGYEERKPVSLPQQYSSPLPTTPTLSPDYTQSLFQWLRERIFDPAAPLLEGGP